MLLRKLSRGGSFVSLVALLLTAARPVSANTGVSDERVSLPDGPGSIGGVGENVDLNLSMGQMSYQVPIRLPQGHAGMTPELGLAYSSGSGVGLLGIGWSMDLPMIERMTVRGLPTYTTTDLFAADGSSELVEAGTDGADPVYRSRREGGFVRYKWHDRAGGDKGYWTAEFPDGRIGYFGADSSGKLIPEARTAHPTTGATFGYQLTEMVDRFGHKISYKYVKSGNMPLLDEITYLFEGAKARFSVRFVYEDRSDLQSDARPGFEVKMLKRLKEVRIFSAAEVIRSYALSYESATTSGGLSRLEKVSEFGRGNVKHPTEFSFGYSKALGGTCQDNCQKPFLVDMGTLPGGVDIASGKATLIDINGDSLPDVLSSTNSGQHTFYLSKLSVDGKPTFQGAKPSSKTVGGSPFTLGAPGVQVLDVNGDGLTDIAATNQVPPAVLCNNGSGDWSGASCLANATLPTLSADDPGDPNPLHVRFFDYDGDKRIDVMRTNSDNSVDIFRNDGTKFVTLSADTIGAVFDESTLQLADMNGDNLQDPVEILGGGQIRYRLNLGRGKWKDWTTVTLPTIDATQLLSAELEDLNGDGLADVVVVLGSELRYSLNRGGDKFDPFVVVTSADVDGDLPVKDGQTTVLFADMNGNGTDDVVWIKGGSVKFLELFPVRPNLLSRIENGIGSVQAVEYGTSASERARDEGTSSAWTHAVPNAMNVVKATDTWVTLTGTDAGGLHDREELVYHEGYYDGTERAFRGFAVAERKLANDAAVDGEEPGLQISEFDVGETDMYRVGLLLKQRWLTGPAFDQPLREERREYGDCPLDGVPATTIPIRFVCQTKSWTIHQEGKAQADWLTIADETEYDGHGNVIKSRALGVVNTGSPDKPGACAPCGADAGSFGQACGPTCVGDEMVTETTYIAPGNATNKAWILNRPVRTLSYADAAGAKAETVFYYDGPEFVGLPEGTLTEGKTTRVSRRVNETDFINVKRSKYNSDGQPVETLDPLATVAGADHRRRYEYDSTGSRVTAVEIPLKDGAGNAYSLRRTTTQEAAFLQVSEASDWVLFEGGKPQTGANTVKYRYDEHGRRSSIIRPGDSEATPSSAFSYDLADPFSRVVTRFHSTPGGALDGEMIDCRDGRGRLYQQRTKLAEGKYLVTGFRVFNKRGTVVKSYQPYESTSAVCDITPPADVLFESTVTDSLGRVLSRTMPGGSIQSYQYEPLASLRFEEEDLDGPFAGTPERASVDGLGRLAVVERLLTQGGTPARMTHSYDSLGNLARVVDAAGNVKTQTYDLIGRPVSVSNPNSGTTVFSYDDAGNLIQRTDADGQVVVSTFDGLNRRVSEYDPKDEAGTKVRWLYDRDADCSLCTNGAGRSVGVRYPVSTDGSTGSDRFGHDTRGRQVWFARQLEGHEFISQYAYDSRDLPAKTTHPDGSVVTLTRDLAGRVTAISGALTSLEYSPQGKPSKATYTNGAVAMWERDEREWLSGLEVSTAKGGKFLKASYARDRAGNVVGVSDSADKAPGRPGRGAAYEYDAWYRLTSADLDVGGTAGEKLTYEYDVIDNVMSRTSSNPQSPAQVGQYSYDKAHPNAAVSAGALSCEYDVTGDMTKRGGSTLVWDHLGRLSLVTDAEGSVSGAVYNGGGARVMKLEGGGVVYHASDSFEIRDGIGVLYTTLGSKRLARSSSTKLATAVLSDVGPGGAPDGVIDISDAWLAQAGAVPSGVTASPVERLLKASARRLLLESSEPTIFLHHDAAGTAVAATGADGTVLGEQDFYPNGQLRVENGFVDAYGFAGYEQDEATGLLHTQRRKLDPLLGRWLSVDPAFEMAGSDSSADRLAEMLSAYAYVSNNPINAVDPTGTSKIKDKYYRFAGNVFKFDRGVNPNLAKASGEKSGPKTVPTSLGGASPEKGVGVFLALKNVSRGVLPPPANKKPRQKPTAAERRAGKLLGGIIGTAGSFIAAATVGVILYEVLGGPSDIDPENVSNEVDPEVDTSLAEDTSNSGEQDSAFDVASDSGQVNFSEGDEPSPGGSGGIVIGFTP